VPITHRIHIVISQLSSSSVAQATQWWDSQREFFMIRFNHMKNSHWEWKTRLAQLFEQHFQRISWREWAPLVRSCRIALLHHDVRGGEENPVGATSSHEKLIGAAVQQYFPCCMQSHHMEISSLSLTCENLITCKPEFDTWHCCRYVAGERDF